MVGDIGGDITLEHDRERARGEVSVERLRLRAGRDLTGFSTGRFARPSFGVRWRSATFADRIEFCGFAFTQFAFPVTGGTELDFVFTPSDGVRSPRAVLPLIARADDQALLLAPVGAAHEQVIAVGDRDLTWGWHGDLDAVTAGFSTELALYRATSVSAVLDAWRSDVAPIRHRRSNPLTTHLSYWTDNGAAYWYRTEPGRTIVESVIDVVVELRDADVPIRAVELDSWWYDHETPRPITEIGYPEDVPPSGTMRWTPRVDAFAAPGASAPASPLGDVRDRLDGAPLVLHARHISPRSPDVIEGTARGEAWWSTGPAAHPADPTFFRRWFDFAAANGVTVLEQDWMLMTWFGVPEMRARPGRALEWQTSMNDQAGATGVDLLWCMATPADLIEAAHLDRVVAVRTCDDYRFADDPAELWTWFLTVNRLAATLGLTAFKDVFFSWSRLEPGDDVIDGDAHAELEAALAALSGGPVGLGDRIGRTDRDVVMRTCDDGGRLRRLDGPIALVDRCLFGGPSRGDGLAWATTTATRDDGTWTYVLAIHTASTSEPIADTFDLAESRAVLDWRAATWSAHTTLRARLAPRDWQLWVVAPIGLDVEALRSTALDLGRYVVVEADVPAR